MGVLNYLKNDPGLKASMLTKVVNISWIGLLTSVVITTTALADISEDGDIIEGSASVEPLNINQNVEIEFDFDVGEGPTPSLQPQEALILGGETQFILTFTTEGGQNYELPDELSTSDVLIDNESVAEIETNGNELILTSPKDAAEEELNLRIPRSAGILNPAEEDTYTISLSTENENTADGFFDTPGDDPPVGDIEFELKPSNTQITRPSVTPNPSVEDTRASYQINFSLGAGGALPADSEIMIEFPSQYDIPQGIIEGVTVNGSSVTASGNGNSVSVYTVEELSNNEIVEVFFSTQGTGIENPSNGIYTLDVSTEIEQDQVESEEILISESDNLSFSSVDVSPENVNSSAAYEIQFVLSETGALQQGEDQIILYFPEGTGLSESSISENRISIGGGGFSSEPEQVDVEGQKLLLTVPNNIEEEQEVEIFIEEGASILNPSEPGNYRLEVETQDANGQIIDELTESNSFTIASAPSQLANINVNIDDPDADLTNYDVSFTTGEFGRLVSGTNTISVRFPDGSGLVDENLELDINIEDFQGANVPEDNISLEEDSLTVTFVVPEYAADIGNFEDVDFTVTNVQNPPEGIYRLEAETSAEPGFGQSGTYEIGGDPLQIEDIEVLDDQVNEVTQYDFEFGNITLDGNEFVTIRFPDGTVIPEGVSIGDVSADLTEPAIGSGTLDEVNLLDDGRSLRFTFSSEAFLVPNDFDVNGITIEQSAGIVNPPLPGVNYEYRVSSSEEPNTDSFDLTFSDREETPELDEVELSPNVANIPGVRHDITFTTGDNGRILGGSSFGSNTIEILFPEEYDLPEVLSSGDIDIEGSSPSSVEVVEFNGEERLVQLGMPDGLVIENNEQATINISSSAGIETPELSDPEADSEEFTYQIRTDVESEFSNEVQVTIDAELDLRLTDISLSDSEANAQSGYNIDFRLGSQDTVEVDDLLVLTFPENTDVPDEISSSRVLLDGTSLNLPTTDEGERSIGVPAPVTLEPGQEYRIQISSNAGVLNPSEPGNNYRTELTIDGQADESPTYTIFESGSTISQPVVELEATGNNDNPKQPEEAVNYTIEFSTGTNGRLPDGEGTITVVFPNENIFDEGAPGQVSLNGNDVSTVSTDQNWLTIEIPEGIKIGNSDEITLVINDLTNPESQDDYSLDVRTSIENDFVYSESYLITIDDPINIMGLIQFGVGANLPDHQAVVNDITHIEIDFDPEEMQDLAEESITIDLPADASIPGSLEGDVVQLTDTNDDDIAITGSEVNVSQSNRTLQFEVPDGVLNTEEGITTIQILPDAEIRNPRQPGSQQVGFSTSLNPNQAIENVVYVSARRNNIDESIVDEIQFIDDLDIRRTTTTPGEPVEWRIDVQTGELGALRPNESTIDLQFPSDKIEITNQSISSSDIQINGVDAEDVTVNGNKVELILGSGVTVGRRDDLEISIQPEAGVQFSSTSSPNRISALNENDNDEYNVSTSSEPDGTQGMESEPLPVEMKEFVINTNPTGFAYLQWTTATERENEGFSVERKIRSTEEEQPNSNVDEVEWEKIAFIESHGDGNSMEAQEYEYLDDELSEAAEYKYRLVQEDFDGSTATYGPESFAFTAPAQAELAQNYPNPFNPVTTIPYQVPEETEVRMDVYNVLGERVQTLVDDQKQPGTYTVDFDGSRLASGVYIVRFQAGGVTETMEITLVK